MRKRILSLIMAALVLFSAGSAQAAEPKELNFGIISTESSQNLRTLWNPFLADMSKALGMKVNAFFASDYAGIIEAMRFKKVDLSWVGNKGAMVMVDRANGEVFAQTTDPDGNVGYWSYIIARKDSGIKNIDDMFARAKDLSFSNGDPNSTSGNLVPGYYVFAKNGKDPKKIFKRVVASNHEANALAVANGQVDVATFNNEGMGRLKLVYPDKAEKLAVIWKSPTIPSDPLVWRKDLSDATKKKIADFIYNYGVSGANVEKERAILAKLQWGSFKKSDNGQLLPLRQIELYRTKMRIQDSKDLSASEKAAQIADIDAKLAAVVKEAEARDAKAGK